jgi:hypothetical protein
MARTSWNPVPVLLGGGPVSENSDIDPKGFPVGRDVVPKSLIERAFYD